MQFTMRKIYIFMQFDGEMLCTHNTFLINLFSTQNIFVHKLLRI